jgi:hypothetical protein
MGLRSSLRQGERREHSTRGRLTKPVLVHVDQHGDDWEIVPPGPAHAGRVTCESLDEARRVAYLCVAHSRPCTLIVREADHHEHRELIGGRVRSDSY